MGSPKSGLAFVIVFKENWCLHNNLLFQKNNRLFSLCDALKERINDSQVTLLNLADALVDGAEG